MTKNTIPCVECRNDPAKKPSCTTCDGKGEMEYKMASNEECEHFQRDVDRVVDLIQKKLKIDGVWVSDESTLDDFLIHLQDGSRARFCFEMAAELGVHVSPFDRVVDMAKRLKKAEEE